MSNTLSFIFIFASSMIIFSACSSSEDQQQESGIKKESLEIANGSTAERIKKPIVEAEAVKKLSGEYNRKLDEAIGDQ